MRKPIKVTLAACKAKQVFKEKGRLEKHLCQKASVLTWSVTDEDAAVEVTWVTERDGNRDPKTTESGGSLKEGEQTKCVCGVEDVVLHLTSTGDRDTATVEIDVCIDWECDGKGKEFEECKEKEKKKK